MKRIISKSPLRLYSILGSLCLLVLIGSLWASRSSASAMMSAFLVNSTADSPDAIPGDGACADSLNRCTLRAAVMEANATVGPNTITVPAGTYTLTRGPYDDEFNFNGADEANGDLDIQNNSLTIIGAGATSTIIDGGNIDRIFDVNSASGSGVAVDFTLQGVTLQHGNAPTDSHGFFEAGGAIQFDGSNYPNDATLTIINSRIINNTASSLGGGIFATNASVIITGSDLSGNTSTHANGGGLAYDGPLGLTTDLLQVTNSTISNNSTPSAAFGSGAGLWVGGGASKTIKYNSITNNHAGAKGGGVFNGNGALDLSYNVIVDNTATGDGASTGFYNNAGAATVQNDWWGCNQGPSFSPCDRASGAVGFGVASWLTLSHTANPNSINTNTSTTLQADFYTNNLGSTILPTDLVALNGRAVSFSNPVLGTISGADTQISNGKANATFTAGPVGGNGSADATVDHATVTAYISINQEPGVTSNPTDQTACEGSSVSFTASSSGYPAPTVQWQVSAGGGPFTDIPGATSSTLTFTAAASQNGNQYRAVFTNNGGTATSTAATLTVNTAPAVTSNPSDQTACEGATVSFSAAGNGDPAPSVQWQVSTNGGGSFSDIPGANSTTLSFTAANSQNGNQYRAVFTNSCGTATSNAATLAVNPNTTATTPADQTVCQGANASFSTTASGTGPFHYAWTVDGSASGGDTSSISVPTGSLSIGSHSVSVTVSGSCSSVTKSASLTVQENTSATAPADQTVCQGATASFSTTASGTGPFHYAWTVDGSSAGGDTSSLSVPTGALSVSAHTVSVTVSGACGSVTKSATLNVNRNTTATALSDQTVCQGATAHFQTSANGTNVSYQWKLDGNVIPGATGNSVDVDTTSLSAGNHSVEVIVTGECGTVNKSATLTVNTAPVVTTNPASQTVISGNATFTAAASGSPTPTVQWQVSTNGGASFSNIAGATSTTLTFATNSSQNGNQYRAVFTNSCGTATTTAATLTTCSPPVVTVNPTSVADACVGAVITFTANATGTPTPTVQWQVSTDGGATYTNIAGATSNTLNVTASVAVRNNKYRAVFTNACGSEPSSAATLGVDTIAPVITINHPTLSMWPPNHQYNTFNVTDFVSGASDNCNANLLSSVVIASVTSDELDENPSGGDGNTTNDMVIAANCKSVQLRAERDGNLNGRVYTITFKVTDSAGNVSTATAKVVVPHDQANGGAVDSGVHNTVSGTCP